MTIRDFMDYNSDGNFQYIEIWSDEKQDDIFFGEYENIEIYMDGLEVYGFDVYYDREVNGCVICFNVY